MRKALGDVSTAAFQPLEWVLGERGGLDGDGGLTESDRLLRDWAKSVSAVKEAVASFTEEAIVDHTIQRR